PAVASDAGGEYVVVWSGEGPGDTDSVFFQRYSETGVPLGGLTRAPTSVAGSQRNPAVAMDADGDFVIVWTGAEGDNTPGSNAHRYTAAGTPVGTEFRVQTYPSGNQYDPAVAMDADGDFVVTWTSFAQDGDLDGVYAQRF